MQIQISMPGGRRRRRRRMLEGVVGQN